MYTLSFFPQSTLVFFSFLAPAFVLGLGRFFGKKGTFALTTFFLWASVFQIVTEKYYNEEISVVSTFKLWEWISNFYFMIEFDFLFDAFNKTMFLTVNTIAICVAIYSVFYMENDPHVIRFYGYVGLFVFFMQLLIVSNNFGVLFFGWEGVGICSFLLVNFWFNRPAANKSALKALFVNRIGDLSLMLGMFVTYFFTGTLDFDICFPIIQLLCELKIYIVNIKFSVTNLIALFFFLGAAGKSAQVGLHTWLPDAMEGPTPVSALIHAATMVTAGILLIIKSSWVFEHAKNILILMSLTGSLSAAFAASVGLFQTDIKKIIAYSTCSQLGYMFAVCGVSNYASSFFHLINHAFFKALLFLSAGSIIHSMQDEQDIRKMGGLFTPLIYTNICFLIGSLTLAGIPFLSGFYSKDFIIETAISKYTFSGIIIYLSGIFTALMTASYSYKTFHFVFAESFGKNKNAVNKIRESNFWMNFVLTTLVFGSIFLGFFVKDKFSGIGTDCFFQTIYTKTERNFSLNAECVQTLTKSMTFLLILPALLIANLFFIKNNVLAKYRKHIIFFFVKKWKFDSVFNKKINTIFFINSYNINFNNLDKGFFEWVGPRGISYFFLEKNTILKSKLIQSGVFGNYSAVFLYTPCIYLFNL